MLEAGVDHETRARRATVMLDELQAAGFAVEPDVTDDDVRIGRADRAFGGVDGGGAAKPLDIGGRADRRLDRGEDRRMVVHGEEADHAASLSVRSRAAKTGIPPIVAGPIGGALAVRDPALDSPDRTPSAQPPQRSEGSVMAVQTRTEPINLYMFVDGASVDSSSGAGSRSAVRPPARWWDGCRRARRRTSTARSRWLARRSGRSLAPDPAAERVTIMNRLGDLLDRDADELARLETLQTGHVVQAPARERLRVRQRQPALLRDADPEPRRQGRCRVHAGAIRASSGASRSAWSARSPVELPALDGDLEDRSGARCRQLDRPQARRRRRR